MPTRIHRRTFLRGIVGTALVSLALPPLEAMLHHNGLAFADGTPLPLRFGTWWWGNGARLNKWSPATQGANWELTEELAPLVNSRGYVSVVGNTTLPDISGPPHDDSSVAMLSGCEGSIGSPNIVIPLFPSIDQVLARRWKGRTRFDSLQLGISRMGYTQIYPADETSTFAPDQTFAAEHSPRQLFDRLFGSSRPNRKSILDVVLADAQDLRKRVGVVDQQRLDQHLESVRSIEQRLLQMPICGITNRPIDPAIPGSNHEPLEEINKAMVDLLILALTCDMTRVFSLTFTKRKGDTVFWQVGATQGIHTITHNENTDRPLVDGKVIDQPTVHNAVVFVMKQFAYLIDQMRLAKIGDKNLLDLSCVFACSEVAEGFNHAHTDFPILLVGKSGGTLNAGTHYRSANGELVSSVMLTMLRALGEADTEFGHDHPTVMNLGSPHQATSALRTTSVIQPLLV